MLARARGAVAVVLRQKGGVSVVDVLPERGDNWRVLCRLRPPAEARRREGSISVSVLKTWGVTRLVV